MKGKARQIAVRVAIGIIAAVGLVFLLLAMLVFLAPFNGLGLWLVSLLTSSTSCHGLACGGLAILVTYLFYGGIGVATTTIAVLVAAIDACVRRDWPSAILVSLLTVVGDATLVYAYTGHVAGSGYFEMLNLFVAMVLGGISALLYAVLREKPRGLHIALVLTVALAPVASLLIPYIWAAFHR